MLNLASPFRRTTTAILVAGACTAALVHYDEALLQLAPVHLQRLLAVRILGVVGAAPAAPPAAQHTPVAKPAALGSSRKPAALKVNASVEQAPAALPETVRHPPAPVLSPDTAQGSQPATGTGMPPLEQPALPPTPQPFLAQPAIRPMPEPPTVSDTSTVKTAQVADTPRVANALDQLNKLLAPSPGLVLAVLVDAQGHAVQVVREQSGGDPVQDAAIIEQMKHRVLVMNPPIPPGQQRWGEFTFNYSSGQDSAPELP